MNNHSKYLAIILAAGKGTRLKSSLPKALYEVCGQSMIDYLIASLSKINFSAYDVIVVGVNHDEFSNLNLRNKNTKVVFDITGKNPQMTEHL